MSNQPDYLTTIRALRATAQRLMGERDALRDALERLVNDCSTYEAWQRPCLHYDAARSLLAQLDCVAPPLTPND